MKDLKKERSFSGFELVAQRVATLIVRDLRQQTNLLDGMAAYFPHAFLSMRLKELSRCTLKYYGGVVIHVNMGFFAQPPKKCIKNWPSGFQPTLASSSFATVASSEPHRTAAA
jgi:hypothetical protein